MQSRKLWIAVVAVLCLAVAGAGAWLGRPAYRQFKEKRALRRAEALAEAGNYPGARLSVRVALSLNPTNAAATRLMAEILDAGSSPAAVEWRRRSVELEPTLDNRLRLAGSALRWEAAPFRLCARVLKEAGTLGETNKAYHQLASQLALRLSQLGDAEGHLERAARLDPADRTVALNLATVRLQSTESNTAAAGRAALLGLAASPGLRLPALRSLVADALRRGEFREAEGAAQRLTALPEAEMEDRLLHLSVLKESGSPELAASLASLQAGSATNAADAARLIGWLQARDLARSAVEWAASLPAGTRQDGAVALAEAECRVALRDWAGLLEQVQAQRWEEREFLRMALLARAMREQGDVENSGRNWRQAVQSAAARPEFTVALLQFARAWGWVDEGKDLLWTAHRLAPSEGWPLQLLLREASARGDTSTLYRVYEVLLRREPRSVEYKNDVAALGLLLGRDLERVAALAVEACETVRTNVTFASTRAFALHRQGRTDEGLKLLGAFSEGELRRPAIALYYGVLLAASGESAGARPYLEAARAYAGLPEERELLEKALTSVR